jgi:hypothetical protein
MEDARLMQIRIHADSATLTEIGHIAQELISLRGQQATSVPFEVMCSVDSCRYRASRVCMKTIDKPTKQTCPLIPKGE